MNALGVLSCAAWLLAIAPAGISGQANPDVVRVFGTVSASDTGRPLADALVELRVDDDGVERLTSARTDSTGAFEFRNLTPGRPFVVVAMAARYLTWGFGQRQPDGSPTRLTLLAGQERDVSIVLPRLGAISGRVLDPFGDPLPGVGVYLFREAEVHGFRRMVAAGRPVEPRPTNDLGQFRLDGLPPGDYYLAVLSGTLNASPRFNTTNELGGFVPTYFPGVTSVEDAGRIRLGLAEQLNDLTVTAVPGRMVRVSGRVVDSRGQPLARALMAITPAVASSLTPAIAGRTQAAEDGSFTFADVPLGSYVVQARSLGTTDAFTGEFGWTRVTVSGSDLVDQVVSTTGPSSVSGRVVFSHELSPPKEAISELRDLFSLRVTAATAELGFDPVIPIASGDPPSRIDSDGTFQIRELWGRRLIRVSSRTPWIVEKISVGGKDVTDTPLEFNGRHFTGVEIVLTKRSASVSGRVTDANGDPIEARVVVFPSDSDSWTAHSRFVAAVSAGRDGTFVVNGLPPGSYLAVAVSMRAIAPTSRTFLQDVRGRATPLVLPEGSTRDIVLALVVR
jgi:protocatechuate 3,4-dioxygenase beta subunit